jgi:hypothetical protein
VGAYDDLIPAATRRRATAYDDLVPAGVAEAPTASAPVEPQIAARVRELAIPELERPARMTLTRGGQPVVEGGTPVPSSDAAARRMNERGDNPPIELPAPEWTDVVRSLPAQLIGGAQNALANLRRMHNEEQIRSREQLLTPATPRPEGTTLSGRVRRAVENQRAALGEDRAALAQAERDAAISQDFLATETPRDMTTAQKAVSSVAQSAPSTLAGISAGILTRNPWLAMTIAGGGGAAQQAGSTYGEAREKGATHDVSQRAAAIDAVLEGVGEALPLRFALKAGSPIGKRLVQTMVAEAGQEGATQLMQDLNAYLSYNPELTLKEAWENLKVATLAGGMGGTVYSGIGHAANAARDREARNGLAAEFERAVREHQWTAPAEQVAVERLSPSQGTTAAGPTPVKAVPPADATAGAYEDLVPRNAEARSGGPVAESQAPVTSEPGEAGVAPGQAAELPPQREPWEKPNAPSEPLTLEDLRIRETLDSMAKHEAGWAEVGGRMIRQQHSEVAGDETISRTKWIPRADWWPGRAGKLNEAQTQVAVRKALAGENLSKREQQAIDYMVEVASQRVAERARISDWAEIGKDLQEAGVGPVHQNVIDVDLVARAAALDEAAVEKAAMQYQNDDAAFMAEVRRILGERENAGAEAPGSRQEGRGAQEAAAAAATRPGLQLETHTEADLAARERAAQEVEARRQAEEQAAERKRAADAQRGSFVLTGSERAADANPNQQDIFGAGLGMPSSTTVTTGPTPPIIPAATAGGATPPAAGAASPAGGKARPDAIRAEIQRLFETVVSEKHQGHRNLGIYRIKPETIRVHNRNDLRTIAHEVGHHISNRNRAFRVVMNTHGNELAAMMPNAYKQKMATGWKMPWKLQVEEGFAEFIADYLGDRQAARTKAPAFFRDFESWLYTNPRWRDAIKQVADQIGAHQQLGPEDKILAKVGMYEPPLRERIGAVLSKDTWDQFAQGALDKWHPLKAMVADLMPGIAAAKNPYTAARLLAGDAAIIEDWISNFTSPYDYAKRADTKNYGKPLKEILAPALGDEQTANRFKAYLIARRAAELKRAGKENLFDIDEIRDGLALETPEFKKVAAEVYDYNDQLVMYAVEGGLISPETALAFTQYTSYIPFFREAETEGGRPGGKGSPFKRLTGGTQNVRDPIANLILNTANIIHATNRNAVLQKAVELAKAVPGGGTWIETVPVPQQAHQLSTQRIIDDLKKQGVTIDTSSASNLAAMQTFFTPSGKADERTRTIVYKRGGELKAAQVNDPLLWKTLGNMPPVQVGLIAELLALPAQTLRAGVVLDPTFMIRNAIRDTLSATIQSKGAFLPVASTVQGFKMKAQHDDAYRLYRAFGGAFADQFREPEEAAKIIERMAKRGGFSAGSILSPWRVLDILKGAGAYAEAGSRIGEFSKTYKPGDIDSALEAALNAREVSTDFGMRGGNEAIQVWTRIVPFMNPALQGIYKAGRVLSGVDGRQAQVKAAVIGTSMALASMALALLNADEDWYQRLEEWEKATYWHFKIGAEIYRVPKPFEYGGLFASAPEAIALLQQGKEDWQDFKKRMLQVLAQVLGLRVVPQAAAIIAEPWANKSMFTGRKLVPDRQQNLEPGLQAGPGTSKSAQVIGEALNYPPAVIDNHVRNTLGTLGVHAVTAADALLEQSGVVPQGRERTWRQWPVIKALVHDPDNPNSKQLRDFYEDLEKYRSAISSVKEYSERGEPEKRERYEEDKALELELAKRAAKKLAGWRRESRRIDWSRDLTPAEKREQANALNANIQAEAEQFQDEARSTRLAMKARAAAARATAP